MTEQPQTSRAPQRFRLSAKSISALVGIAIAATFIVQNRDTVRIQLFITTISGPLWAALTGMLLFGALCGYLLARRRR